MTQFYPLFLSSHYWLSRIGLAAAVSMFIVGFVMGVLRKRDVTPWYRWGVYLNFGAVVIQIVLGGAMYAIGGRPYDEVHLIYGLGAFLCLPFFIYVEQTAKRRPALGSYIWGFAVLAGIFIRAIMTGAA
jgi:heme A synthase